MTQAVKGFNKDWTCRGFQFAPGQTYAHAGPVKACEEGFHAIEGHPLEVFSYYPPATSRYASVTLAGTLAREKGVDSKVAAEILTVGTEISLADLIGKAVHYVVSHAKPPKGASVKAQGSAAQALGYQGAAQASGDQGAAQASGNQGAAQASGNQGAAQASGNQGAAQASGYQGAAQALGHQGAAQASGHQGAAQASGYQGAAQALGYQGAAQASGDQGAAQASGDQGAAQALGKHSTALASGEGGKASGKDGSALFLVYRCPSTGAILHAWAGIVGQNNLKPDVFYTLNPNGQPEELA
jgi:hypothetical protein